MRATLNLNTKSIRTRKIALALCGCIILAVLLSLAFFISHAGHKHDVNGPDGRCAICIQITSAQHLLKQLSIAVLAASFAFGSLHSVFSSLKAYCISAGFATPISLKVRLNN